jgi:hypothetical protein
MKNFMGLLCLFGAFILGQTTPSPKLDKPVAPLTDAEKIPILSAQKTLAYKYTAYLQKKAELSQAENETSAASEAVTKAWTALEEARHLKPGEAVRCDGPQPGPCEKVAVGDVALVPKPEVKK